MCSPDLRTALHILAFLALLVKGFHNYEFEGRLRYRMECILLTTPHRTVFWSLFSYWLYFYRLAFSLQTLHLCFSFIGLSKHVSDTTISWIRDSTSLETLGIRDVQAQADRHPVHRVLRDLGSRGLVESEQRFSEFWISLTCEVKRKKHPKLRSITELLSYSFWSVEKKLIK